MSVPSKYWNYPTKKSLVDECKGRGLKVKKNLNDTELMKILEAHDQETFDKQMSKLKEDEGQSPDQEPGNVLELKKGLSNHIKLGVLLNSWAQVSKEQKVRMNP